MRREFFYNLETSSQRDIQKEEIFHMEMLSRIAISTQAMAKITHAHFARRSPYPQHCPSARQQAGPNHTAWMPLHIERPHGQQRYQRGWHGS